jgi:hypothetical protein
MPASALSMMAKPIRNLPTRYNSLTVSFMRYVLTSWTPGTRRVPGVIAISPPYRNGQSSDRYFQFTK